MVQYLHGKQREIFKKIGATEASPCGLLITRMACHGGVIRNTLTMPSCAAT